MKKAVILFGLLILTFSGLFADTITLEQVRSLALANSRSLAKYNLNIQSADLNEKARVYSNLPTPSLGASAGMSLWNPTGAGPLSNPFNTFSAGASLSIRQNIFQGGKSLVQKAINSLASESARKGAQAEYFNVLGSADSAYYDVLKSAASLDAAESALQIYVTSLNIAEVRYTNGMINLGDYLKAQSDKASQENTRNQAKRDLALKTIILKSLIGFTADPQPVDIDFSGYEDLIQRMGNLTDDDYNSLYSQFITQVNAVNPSLAQSMLAAKIAEENLTMAKRGFAPSLGASFSTGLNYIPSNNTTSLSKTGLNQTGGSLSLSLSIPVDVWNIANNVDQSKIARDQANLDYASASDQTVTNVQSGLMNALNYAEQIIYSRAALDYAQKNFEFVQESYRLNQSSVTDLENASSQLNTSRNSLITAQYGFMQSLATLRSLVAVDDEQKLVTMLMGN